MKSRTLLVSVPAQRSPRRGADRIHHARAPWLSPREMDTLLFVYEARAVDPATLKDTDTMEPAAVPASGSALGMYYLARRLELAGLLDMRTTTRPDAQRGYNPHSAPTHYAWYLTLTREGEERVAQHLARAFPRRIGRD